jgi:hypothetical protein
VKFVPFSAALACFTFRAAAAVVCQEDNAVCDLYFNQTGSLVERGSGSVIASNIGNVGAFSDVAVYKYGSQYALVQTNNSNDRLVTVIPLLKKKKEWIFNSFYYFSISLKASSVKHKPLWVGSKIDTKENKISNDILDRAGDSTFHEVYSRHIPSGWPSTSLYIATGPSEPKGEECFVPFDSREGLFPIETIACRALKIPVSNGDYGFSGTIGDSLFIELTLTKDGDDFVGRYRYLKHPNEYIRVKGRLARDGSFAMSEFGKKGDVVSSRFNGSIVSGKISGRWEASDKSKNFPFSVYLQGFPQ